MDRTSLDAAARGQGGEAEREVELPRLHLAHELDGTAERHLERDACAGELRAEYIEPQGSEDWIHAEAERRSGRGRGLEASHVERMHRIAHGLVEALAGLRELQFTARTAFDEGRARGNDLLDQIRHSDSALQVRSTTRLVGD
jgi:hypothetical protein